MRGRVYRGTTFAQAQQEEFATREIHGDTFETFEGWMDPEDADDDYSGADVGDMPWEMGGPERGEVSVCGGISNRLGAAQSFAGGGLPVVLHLDESQIPTLLDVRYDHGWFDRRPGALAWVNGTSDGEVRVNGTLKGLTTGDGLDSSVSYYGDHFGQYEDEMEQLVMGESRIPIDSAVEGVVSYVRRPIAHLTTFDGYERLDTRMTEAEDTVVGDWSDERAASVLYDELRDAAPGGWDTYLVLVNSMLVKESWGYNESHVDAVFGLGGEVPTEDAPEYIFGD